MIKLHPKYITDDKGKKLSVVLPIKDYEKIMKGLDELEDVRLYDRSKKGKQDFMDADKAFEEIERERSIN